MPPSSNTLLDLPKYFHRKKLRKNICRGIIEGEEEEKLSIKKVMVLLTVCGSDVSFLTRNVFYNEMENL